jgi:hypothetical protein
MAFQSGQPLVELLESAETARAFSTVLREVLTELVPHGYLAWRVPAPQGTFGRIHLDRVARRLPLLRRAVAADVLADGLVVNGQPGCGVGELLACLQARPRLMGMLDPQWLYFPLHGDLNLGNILVRDVGPDPRYTVLDPRGQVGPWDIGYDLSKMLFSLVGLHNAMRNGFAITRTGPGAYEVDLRGGQTETFDTAADGFHRLIEELDAFAAVRTVDPHWRLRLAVGLAMHAMAEAACRLSDRKPRVVGGRRGPAARRELATGLHLMGAVMLSRLLAVDDRELAIGRLPSACWRERRS